MKNTCQLIVMLTRNDLTVENAANIFEQCKDSPAVWFGFKEKPLPPEQMKALCERMKECGKHTALEVVAYSEEESLKGAQLAADCGFEMVMGTKYSPAVHALCRKKGMKYMPFVGEVDSRPSILHGNIEDLLAEAEELAGSGVDGIDLLGFRAVRNPENLITEFVSRCSLPVCVAGSIDSFARLETVRGCKPWAFTIGSAFFEQCFGESMDRQIDRVCKFMECEDDGE